MKVVATPLEGVVVVESPRIGDERGSFARWFCEAELGAVLQGRRIVQANHSRTSSRGTVRGMHFQRAPHAEMKFVRCLRGKVWDVAVDLRAGSPTLLRWHGEELTPDNGRMLVVPEGCAHGFQALEDDCELLYLHTAAYAPGAEGGIDPRDARVGIAWPEPVQGLSTRDRSHPRLDERFEGLAR